MPDIRQYTILLSHGLAPMVIVYDTECHVALMANVFIK